jgi:hypothetical protein
MKWWDWLGTLSQGQATFLGWFAGLLALLVGALFNAHLNRKRDDRLRAEERRSAAIALRAELAGYRHILLRNSEEARKGGFSSFTVPDFAHSIRIMPQMIPKLGLFDQETVERVAEAHRVIERHGEGLFLLGGRLDERVPDKRLVSLPADTAPHVIEMNSAVSEVLDKAIAQLDASLRTKRWWWPWH